jgi:hypothetical protein
MMMGFWFWLDKKVKVVLVRVVRFLFTKLYNVSHFARIPAVPPKDTNLRTREIRDIAQAIERATAEYGDKLERWLNRLLPTKLDEVIIGGGAAYHLEPELEIYFNCEVTTSYESGSSWGSQKKVRGSSYERRNQSKNFTPMIWGAGIAEIVKKTFDLDKAIDGEQCLSQRLIDCFGMFDYLLDKGNS